MGEIERGIPKRIALRMKEKYEIKCFIETGTLIGKTAEWAARQFETVHTIEFWEPYAQRARATLRSRDNATIHIGHSPAVLAQLLPRIEERALLWLDAHWSRDLPYGRPDSVCPIMEELAALKGLDIRHVVVIDDARLFGMEVGWPDLYRVSYALHELGYRVRTAKDCIIGEPSWLNE